MKNKTNIIKAALVVGTVIICLAICIGSFHFVSNFIKNEAMTGSDISKLTSNYDYNKAPDAKYAGNYKISSATVTDKHNKSYNVTFKDFNLSLNEDGSCYMYHSSPYFDARASAQMDADEQARIDALSDSERAEYNKEKEDAQKYLDEQKQEIEGSQSRIERPQSELAQKYKLLFAISSDAGIPNIDVMTINSGTWRNNDTNLLIVGGSNHAEFEIQSNGTLIYKIGNLTIVLQKA